VLPSVARLLLVGFLVTASGSCSPTPDGEFSAAPRSFAVEALSRGAGVPEEAYDAQDRALAVMERDEDRGLVVAIRETGIGLEGETRLCVEYRSAQAADAAFREVSDIVRGLDLVNLVRPCSARD